MNQATVQLAIKLYQNGLTTIEIGEELKIPQSTIWYRLNKAGIKFRKSGYKKGDIRILNNTFAKGQTAWNKGKHISLEQRKRQSATRKQLFKTGKLIAYWKNKKIPLLVRQKMSQIKKDQIKNGLFSTKIIRKELDFSGINHPQWKGGLPKCPHCKKELNGHRKRICRKCWFKFEAKIVGHIRPNKPEKIILSLLDKYFPKEWKYTGDGDVWIGRKNPDFLNINGQKKIIEVYGNYWHKNDNPQDRIDYFKKYGFDTLVIWENECYKSKEYLFQLINKLNKEVKGNQ